MSALPSSADKGSAPSVRAPDNYERLTNALNRVADVRLDRLTVRDMLTIQRIRVQIDSSAPFWDDQIGECANALEAILQSANAGSLQPLDTPEKSTNI